MLYLALALLVVGAAAEDGLDLEVSTKGMHLELSREKQKSEWLDLQDEKYNSKGFMQWKPQKDGFILRNLDSTTLSCKVKTKSKSRDAMKVGFDCKALPNAKESKVVQSAASAHARFMSIGAKDAFTPMQEGHRLEPLNPKIEMETEVGSKSRATWGREVNIDDSVFEGESETTGIGMDDTAEKEDHTEQQWLDTVDLGPGSLFTDEEDKHQTLKHKFSKIKKKNRRKNNAMQHPELVDTPYVDAGVDREVNDRMYEFFKKHPQYHTPEAHWRAARKWKHILDSARNSPGQDADSDKSSMWEHNSCDSGSKVPTGWPDIPTMKCATYAVSPMGYWGCQWLFEDGTCGYIQFYPTIRWDGLDAYVTKDHDPQDMELLKKGAFPSGIEITESR